MPTIADALREARRRFEPVSDSASLDAQVLLADILGVDRAYLFTHPERSLSDDVAGRFDAWVERHAAGEPVAYLLGRRGFYDLEFKVTPDVLIPRPETELLLEAALAQAALQPALTAVDVGTGSGALAVTFAVHAPAARVYAVDLSERALAVARDNAAAHGVLERITFIQGDLLAPLIEQGVKVNLVMANLPYIASHDVPRLAVSRYEPTLALDGGPDGLLLVERLLRQLREVCLPGALALLEIGADQGARALALTRAHTPGTASVHQDYAGLDRILRIELNA